MAKRNGYKVGDQVVYPHHGVATIERIEEKEVLGQKKKYLVLRLDAGDLTLMVPADACEQVGVLQRARERIAGQPHLGREGGALRSSSARTFSNASRAAARFISRR